MDYPEADFDIDTAHLTVSHKPSGTVFRFNGHPDPINGNEVHVSLPRDVCESELPGMSTRPGSISTLASIGRDREVRDREVARRRCRCGNQCHYEGPMP